MHFGKNANKSRSSEPFHMWIYEMKPLSTSVILTYSEICLRLPSIMGERGIWQLVLIVLSFLGPGKTEVHFLQT